MTTAIETPRGKRIKKRPPVWARRIGYLAALLALGVVWYLVGQIGDGISFDFLTPDVDEVIPWVQWSIFASMAAQFAYIAYDPRWFKALGEAATSLVSAIVALKVYVVFPFDFTDIGGPWETITRWVLIFGIVGGFISVVVYLVKAVLLLNKREESALEP